MTTAMDKERFEELCAAYMVNALGVDELRGFERALKEADADMRKLYDEMRWTALHLPLSVEPATPSPELKQRILRAVRSGTVEKDFLTKLAISLGFHRPRFALTFSFVLLLAVGGLLYYTFFLREMMSQRDQRIAVLQSELSTAQQRFAAVKQELARQEEILKVLQSPKIDVVIMQGQEANPAGYGKIIWDPEKRSAILQISNLPPVPQDKDYQLWLIKDKKPISAGVFSVSDPQKDQFFRIERLVESNKKAIDAFAVTLEPKGGVPQPTGTMYLLGTPSL